MFIISDTILHNKNVFLIIQRPFFLAPYRIISNAVGIKNKIFSWDNWEEWCLNLIQRVKTLGPSGLYEASDAEEDWGESPALEVLNDRDTKGYFAGMCDLQVFKEIDAKHCYSLVTFSSLLDCSYL